MPTDRRSVSSRQLSIEEKELWNNATKNIAPLTKKQNNATQKPLSGLTSAYNEPSKTLLVKTRAVIPDADPKQKITKENPIDRKTRLRLSRGRIAIEARIDLHGMIQKNAHDALLRFLETAYNEKKRHVLVITGKGRQAEGGVGVLRGIVPKWLTTPPMRNWVRAHSPAGPRDGGDGALYISMKRLLR